MQIKAVPAAAGHSDRIEGRIFNPEIASAPIFTNRRDIMKHIITAALALSLLGGTAALAQPGRGGPGRGNPGFNDQSRYDGYRNNPGVRMSQPRFSRGDRVPDQYRSNRQYDVNDWQQRHLRKPPRGYHWVRDDNDNYFLAAVTTGIILDLLLNGGH
jgi:Ni/Co efflux regulator RcnB